MVHAEHTAFTERAVMSSRWLDFIAAITKFELDGSFLFRLIALSHSGTGLDWL